MTRLSGTEALAAALCLFAAARVLVFGAAFPPFNNQDEPSHYATVLEYGRGRLPDTGMIGTESARDIAALGSPEYARVRNPGNAAYFIPYWTDPARGLEPANRLFPVVRILPNAEAMQPPLYYLLADAWRTVGLRLGLGSAKAFYWLRSLNALLFALFMAAAYVVCMGYFPGREGPAVAVLLLLAAFPQSVFYGLSNDVLSPLVGAACLLAWLEVRRGGGWTGWPAAGLLTAACLLTKLTNAAMAAAGLAAAADCAAAAWRKSPRTAAVAAGAAAAAFLVPVLLWNAHCRVVFGDDWGLALKLRQTGWFLKPWRRLWPHPLFSVAGALFFFNESLARFWRGEALWGNQPIRTALDGFFTASSALFLAAAAWPGRRDPDPLRSFTRRFCWLSVAGSWALLAYWSVAYDFGSSRFYPTASSPFVVSGRLLMGVLLPFLLLYVDGADRLFEAARARRWLVPCAGLFAAAMLASWTWAARPVFYSPFNLFHMPAAVPALTVSREGKIVLERANL